MERKRFNWAATAKGSAVAGVGGFLLGTQEFGFLWLLGGFLLMCAGSIFGKHGVW